MIWMRLGCLMHRTRQLGSQPSDSRKSEHRQQPARLPTHANHSHARNAYVAGANPQPRTVSTVAEHVLAEVISVSCITFGIGRFLDFLKCATAMMGCQQSARASLLYAFDLDDHVPPKHPPRDIDQLLHPIELHAHLARIPAAWATHRLIPCRSFVC